jgi:AraC-like DNA-binding protein
MRLRRFDPHELIRRAKEYLAQTPQLQVGLVQAARAVGVSPSSLALAFRKGAGMGFYRYALNWRLARAAQLLACSDDLTRLAHDLGFSSHSHFSTAFRRWAGRTPSAYREAARGRAAIA